MATIYLIRHSKTGKDSFISRFYKPLNKNVRFSLGEEGRKIAEKKLSNKILNDVTKIYSSNYKRAYQTSLFLAKRLNLKVIKDKRFGERIHGIKKSYSELPENFEMLQFNDETFKMPSGESQNMVRKRMLDGLYDILNNNEDNTIAIFTHSTAMIFLLKHWCESEDFKLKFNNKIIFDGKVDYVECYKLEFKENALINIENIKL